MEDSTDCRCPPYLARPSLADLCPQRGELQKHTNRLPVLGYDQANQLLTFLDRHTQPSERIIRNICRTLQGMARVTGKLLEGVL